jgi:radical SAM superfamily enzyme YgiQ (UPF0313 family)
MKVLLVSPNTSHSPYPVYPLGLDYLYGAISEGRDVEIADMNVLKTTEALRKVLGRFNPDVVGISIRNIDNTDLSDPYGFYGENVKIADVVRENSKALLVLGGCGFTIFPRELMALLKADYGIVGEGERFASFLQAIEKNEDEILIPGVVKNPFTELRQRKFPPPWDGVFGRKFTADRTHVNFYLEKGGMLNLQTKRGCRFKCVYCTYPHIEGRKLRLVPPEKAAETALELQNAGATYFFITDSAFNVDIAHSLEVARAFIKRKISIPWGAFFAPVRPPSDYFRIMADAGLTHVEFGTESLSDDVLLSYQKPFRASHVFTAHQEAVDAGLYAAHYFLMGGPGETPESVEQTLANIDKLKKKVVFFFAGMRIYPHTDLYEIALRQGKIDRKQNLLEPVYYKPDSLDPALIVEKIKKMAKSRPNWMVGSGGEETLSILSKMFARGFTGPLWEHLIR